MESIKLKLEDRTVLGKKVKALRRVGKTPANIFGPGLESLAVQSDSAEAEKVLAKAGSSHLITLEVPSRKEPCRVLVRKVQRDAMTGRLVHIDFFQVSMKEKVRVQVPLSFKGVAAASGRKDLLVLENLRSLEIECLPEDIPESIPVDMRGLAEAGDHLLVGGLQLGDRVAILTHPEEVIARVGHLRKAEIEEEAKPAAPAEGVHEEGKETEETL